MSTTDRLTGDEAEAFLDRVFAKAALQLSIRQSVEERVEAMVEFPHTVTLPSGEKLSTFQRVEEEANPDNPLDDESVGWTVTHLDNGVVTMKNQPAWDRTKEIPVEEWDEERYTPITDENGDPLFAY